MNEDSPENNLKVLDNIMGELVGVRQQMADLITSENSSRMLVDALRENERKSREALRENERKSREVIENLPQRIFVKDKNLAYRYCNESYARDRQIQPNEIVGKSDYDFYPKELAAKYIADEQRILSTGQTEEIEDRYLTSGQELTILSTKIPLKDEMGNVTGILATFWDISERKKAEEEARNYILRLKKLVFERSVQIESLNDQLHKEAAERKRIEEELQRVRASLEGGSVMNVRQVQIAK